MISILTSLPTVDFSTARLIKAMEAFRATDVSLYSAADRAREDAHNAILLEAGVTRDDQEFAYELAVTISELL